MTTFRKWYFRGLLIVAPVEIITGVVGWFTSTAFWSSTWRVFMGLVFLGLAFNVKKSVEKKD